MTRRSGSRPSARVIHQAKAPFVSTVNQSPVTLPSLAKPAKPKQYYDLSKNVYSAHPKFSTFGYTNLNNSVPAPKPNNIINYRPVLNTSPQATPTFFPPLRNNTLQNSPSTNQHFFMPNYNQNNFQQPSPGPGTQQQPSNPPATLATPPPNQVTNLQGAQQVSSPPPTSPVYFYAIAPAGNNSQMVDKVLAARSWWKALPDNKQRPVPAQANLYWKMFPENYVFLALEGRVEVPQVKAKE
jgi:hypothetical protein